MKHKKFIPNLKKIEIEITTNCNLKCSSCDRSCGLAPSDEFMSVQQIEKFVQESIDLNWEWSYIGLIGGEPTLHPNLLEIYGSLKPYINFNKNCIVELVTNGLGQKARRVMDGTPSNIRIRNSNKKSSSQFHDSYMVAPIDIDEFNGIDFSTGCWITQNCGIALSRYGYYPCGAGASVDRVHSFDIGIKDLKDVTVESMTKSMSKLCGTCGHFKSFDIDMPGCTSKWSTDNPLSKTWKLAYDMYSIKKPELGAY